MKSTPAVTEPVGANPEFIRLPAKGADPIFSLSRSTYYALEGAGKLQMKRLYIRGSIQPIVLIPVADVRALIKSESGAA